MTPPNPRNACEKFKLRHTWFSSPTLFQFRLDYKFLLRAIIFNMQQIRLATHLAIFYVGLAPARELVDRSHIPLSATGALEATFHFNTESLL